MPPDAGGLPPPTYQVLANFVGLSPKSVGRGLMEDNLGVPWEEALEVSESLSPFEDETSAGSGTRMGGYGDSLKKLYFLVTTGGRVTVLYGWRPCRPLLSSGNRMAGLLGDKLISPGGLTAPPQLSATEGPATDQWMAFAPWTGRLRSVEELKEHFADQPGSKGMEAPEEGDEIKIWKTLPVHPKIAALFISGLAPSKAISLVDMLSAALPHGVNASVLTTYIRGACTLVGDTPAVQTNWNRQDYHASAALAEWYLLLCEAYAPEKELAPRWEF